MSRSKRKRTWQLKKSFYIQIKISSSISIESGFLPPPSTLKAFLCSCLWFELSKDSSSFSDFNFQWLMTVWSTLYFRASAISFYIQLYNIFVTSLLGPHLFLLLKQFFCSFWDEISRTVSKECYFSTGFIQPKLNQ